eukprot:653946-Rhodomonas_salina.1
MQGFVVSEHHGVFAHVIPTHAGSDRVRNALLCAAAAKCAVLRLRCAGCGEAGHGECTWEPMTVSLTDADGDPFEGSPQLSQLNVLRPCS